MRARDRPENGDQNHQDRAGRQRVAEQRQRDILGQVSAMMPEPTTVATSIAPCPSASATRRRGKSNSDISSPSPGPSVAPSMRPMSRSLVPSDSWSMLANGRLVKIRDAVLEIAERRDEGRFLLDVRALRPRPGPRCPNARSSAAPATPDSFAGRVVANREDEIHHRRVGARRIPPSSSSASRRCG